MATSPNLNLKPNKIEALMLKNAKYQLLVEHPVQCHGAYFGITLTRTSHRKVEPSLVQTKGKE